MTAKEKVQHAKLIKMVEEERQKVAGYEQVAKVHSAYISILLKKLGATRDNMITITGAEVAEALEKYEARALVEPETNSFKLYTEELIPSGTIKIEPEE